MHKDYERFLATKTGHMKPTTFRTLRAQLSRLPPPEDLTEKWLQGRMKEVSPQTCKNEQKLAIRMLKFLGLPAKEMEEVKLPKIEGVTVDELFTAEDLEKIFSAAYDTRDRSIVRVLYESAARASELLSMQIEDIRFNEDKTAHVTVKGKTGTRELLLYRSVPSLKAWIDSHPTGEGAVWVTLKGELSRLSYTGLFQVIKKIMKRAGLRKRKACHMFRHSRLTELVKLGIRGEHLRKFAGWEPGSAMEARYVHLSQIDVENELRSKAYGLEENGKYEPMMVLKECPHCGEKNDSMARVCMSCGRGMRESASELDALKDQVSQLENLIKQVANGQISQDWLKVESFKEPPKAEQERVLKELEEQIEAKDAEKKAAKKDGGKASESPEVKKLREQTKRERSLTLKSKKKEEKNDE